MCCFQLQLAALQHGVYNVSFTVRDNYGASVLDASALTAFKFGACPRVCPSMEALLTHFTHSLTLIRPTH